MTTMLMEKPITKNVIEAHGIKKTGRK